MENLLQYLPVGLVAVGLIAGYVTLRGDVKTNTTDIKKHDDLLTSGTAGGAPFLTDLEHDKLQILCQEKIDLRIKNMEKDLSVITETIKEGDECRKEAREESVASFAALRKEVGEHHTNVAVLVAGIQSDIKHLMTRRKGD